MRIAGGYAVLFGPNGDQRETDTFTCAHCNTLVHAWQRRPDELGGFCRSCMKMICPKCVGFSCDPIEKKLERAEARDAARRSYSEA